MTPHGPLMILEDDPDDQEFIRDALQQIGFSGQVRFFVRPQEALRYLMEADEQPFLILTDMNLPEMNGLEFQKRIHGYEQLRRKSIPFIFFSTSDSPFAVEKAYEQTVQGYFQKPFLFSELKERLRIIIDYWLNCRHPYQMYKGL